MSKKSLPPPPAENAPESHATERPSPTDCQLVRMAKVIEQSGPFAPSDSWLWCNVTQFHDFAESHLDDVRQSVLRWLKLDTDNTRTAVMAGNCDAAIATLVCVTDWVFHARENDGVGVGSSYKPLIPRLGLDIFEEIELASASAPAVKMRTDLVEDKSAGQPPASVTDGRWVSLDGEARPGEPKESTPGEPTKPQPVDSEKKKPTMCGRLHVKTWNHELTYPVTARGVTETNTFHIEGVKRWEDLQKLMEADGNFTKVPHGFLQRWNKGEALKLRQAAFEAASKRGHRGSGLYRLIK